MMTLLCLCCAVLAVWWAVPPPMRPRAAGPAADSPGTSSGTVEAGAAGSGPRPPHRRRRPVRVLLGAAASGAVIGVAVLVEGGRGAALALAGLVLGWTVAGLTSQRSRGRAIQRRRFQVAQACTALAAQLRVGQVPSVALATAAADHRVLLEARDAQDLGGDVVRVWRAQAQRPGLGGLLDLARGWQISTRTGAPMATTLEQVAAALVAEQSLQALVAGELSAPRATGKVMAALPVCGIGMGYLLGGEPVDWLLAGPLGWGCLVGGVGLACLGVLWIETLARRAAT